MKTVLALAAFALLAFGLVLVARVVFDWLGVLAPAGAARLGSARGWTGPVTEPVIAPVGRLVPPLRVGSVSIDVAFNAVFVVAVVVLRT